MDSFMRNSQPVLKSRIPATTRVRTEMPPSASLSDPRVVSVARNELENLMRKPARTAEEK